MEATTIQKPSNQSTEQNMLDYFATHDVKYVADDGVFVHMGTGEKYKGRAEVGAMLNYFYHVAFDARAEMTHYMISENQATIEGFFKGTHIGEFAGVAATNREVNVPICVTYNLENGLIKEARIYMPGEVLMKQLSVLP